MIQPKKNNNNKEYPEKIALKLRFPPIDLKIFPKRLDSNS